MSRTKYVPYMKDRVRVAWTDKWHAEWRSVTGTVCGLSDGCTTIELDQPKYGLGILRCYNDEFRLELYDA